MNEPVNEGSAIDSIEHQLYDPKIKINDAEIHQTKSHKDVELPTSWGGSDPIIRKAEEEKGMSFGTKLFLFSTILLVAALSFSAWRVFSLRNVVSSVNIDMSAEITPYVEGGVATPLILTLHNRNTSALQSASVTLLYKQGNGSQDEQEKVQVKSDIGTINSNEYKRQDFTVSLYGQEAESRDIVVKLEYKVVGSNAVFTKLVTTQVVLSTPPVSVHIDGPSAISVGQSGDYTFTIKNNSASTSLPSILQITPPNSFRIENVVPKTTSRNNSWSIAPLLPGETQKITVTGTFDGKEGEIGTFQAKIGSVGDSPQNIGVVYSSNTTDVTLHASPITVSINLMTESSQGENLHFGDKATFTLTYTNTSNQALNDAKIVLQLSGDAALYASINPTTGYYDSIKRTITWDSSSLPDLAVLPPGAQGTLQVIVPIVSKGTNSPTLTATLLASASSKTSNSIVSTFSKTWGVQGKTTLEASTQYKTSPFANSGPIPPQANKDTTYTAHFKVTAQNALSAARVSFTLPSYVTWRGVTSDASSISYDAQTRTVTWNLQAVPQGSSVIADISLSVRPSQSHVNQTPTITSGIILDADEAVSRSHLRNTLSPLTVAVKNELWPSNPSVVVGQ